MQRIDNIKRAAAEIYWQIQEEITNCTLMEYMYHDVRLESNNNLPKWVGRKTLSKKTIKEINFQVEILYNEYILRFNCTHLLSRGDSPNFISFHIIKKNFIIYPTSINIQKNNSISHCFNTA